jgi:ferredoxin
MLDAVSSIWREAGLHDRLHVERFHPATVDLRAADTPAAADADGSAAAVGAVEAVGAVGGGEHLALFATSDVLATCAGERSLLEVAEAAGLAPPSGCRMGICHTCTTELLDGEVVDLRDGRRTGPGGFVQLCVTAALTDVTLGR